MNEAYRVYTRIDPEAPENQQTINIAFAAQAAPVIWCKLQKLEGFAGMNLSQLVEIAQRVFNNREALDDPKHMAKIQSYCHQSSQTQTPRSPFMTSQISLTLCVPHSQTSKTPLCLRPMKFTDRSNFMQEGRRYAGAAVITLTGTI